MDEVKRYKVTTDAGRVFYVYGASEAAALRTFTQGCPDVTARLVEEDTGEWKTTLQEGPTAAEKKKMGSAA